MEGVFKVSCVASQLSAGCAAGGGALRDSDEKKRLVLWVAGSSRRAAGGGGGGRVSAGPWCANGCSDTGLSVASEHTASATRSFIGVPR